MMRDDIKEQKEAEKLLDETRQNLREQKEKDDKNLKESQRLLDETKKQFNESKERVKTDSKSAFFKKGSKKSVNNFTFAVLGLFVLSALYFYNKSSDDIIEPISKKGGLVNLLGQAPDVSDRNVDYVDKPNLTLPDEEEEKEEVVLTNLPPLPTDDKKEVSEWFNRKLNREKESQFTSTNPKAVENERNLNTASNSSNSSNNRTINSSDYESPFDSNESNLANSLKPTVTESVQAQVLPNRDYLITKGTSIDCTLVNAIDTSVEGFVTCRTANDIYSDSGRVLLVEKGSKVVGEYRKLDRSMGDPRLFVLWSRLTTPLGVAVDLNSAGTDSLGRAGVSGDVDNFWFKRFGSAFMTSIMQDSLQIAINEHSKSNSSVTIDSTSNTSDALINALIQQHAGIMPRLVKNQGEMVRIYVSRDINFSEVYRLKRK